MRWSEKGGRGKREERKQLTGKNRSCSLYSPTSCSVIGVGSGASSGEGTTSGAVSLSRGMMGCSSVVDMLSAVSNF